MNRYNNHSSIRRAPAFCDGRMQFGHLFWFQESKDLNTGMKYERAQGALKEEWTRHRIIIMTHATMGMLASSLHLHTEQFQSVDNSCVIKPGSFR
jgi:hypothetical protein